MNESVSPADEVRRILAEVEKFGEGLEQRERWLVFTKKDLLLDEEFEERRPSCCSHPGWDGPVFSISSVTGEGVDGLVHALMDRLEALRQEELEPGRGGGGRALRSVELTMDREHIAKPAAGW